MWYSRKVNKNKKWHPGLYVVNHRRWHGEISATIKYQKVCTENYLLFTPPAEFLADRKAGASLENVRYIVESVWLASRPQPTKWLEFASYHVQKNVATICSRPCLLNGYVLKKLAWKMLSHAGNSTVARVTDKSSTDRVDLPLWQKSMAGIGFR